MKTIQKFYSTPILWIVAIVGVAVVAIMMVWQFSSINTPEWKSKLGFPANVTAIAPIVVGVPSVDTSETSRKEPVQLVNDH